MHPTESPPPRRAGLALQKKSARALSPSERRSCARWSTARLQMEWCDRAPEWQRSGSARTRSSASPMRLFRVRMNPERLTTTYCAPSSTTRRFGEPPGSSTPAITKRTSSAIRFLSNGHARKPPLSRLHDDSSARRDRQRLVDDDVAVDLQSTLRNEAKRLR